MPRGRACYSTFLGGIDPSAIAVDSKGAAYVAGTTYDAPPLKNAFQATAGGGGDAFVTKLNAAGPARLLYLSRRKRRTMPRASRLMARATLTCRVTHFPRTSRRPRARCSLSQALGRGSCPS